MFMDLIAAHNEIFFINYIKYMDLVVYLFCY
jgi:hypothetical protein